MPILAEDSAAVPVQVSVEHPMEPDHYIRSLEVTLDKDPVPWKGKFNFTPGNGRAWVAFTMRSGTGGLVRAVAECSVCWMSAGWKRQGVRAVCPNPLVSLARWPVLDGGGGGN
jgi:predicted secreted protein